MEVKNQILIRNVIVLVGILVLMGLFGCKTLDSGERLSLDQISLPEGFHISLYAYPVNGARSMSLSSDGTLFVGTRGAGKVYAIKDLDSDYVADEILTIASGLRSPNGVAFKDGDLYVAEISRVLRFENILDHIEDASYSVVYDEFPRNSLHGWKFIRFGPDGKLYVPVGVPCNVCLREEPFGSITRMDSDGSNFEIYATGVRNSVGFDWDPDSEDLWFTDNGRDWFGEDVPPDELNHVSEKGMHFGFPYCHGKGLADDGFTDKKCFDFSPAVVEFGPHVAALGMRFYTQEQFPEKYSKGIFIAEHGSWNRKVPIGYRISFVDHEKKDFEIFASGWLSEGKSWGRPVDIEVMPDGSLLVSDDKADAIYRIYYQP